jgi:hypothetical protein
VVFNVVAAEEVVSVVVAFVVATIEEVVAEADFAAEAAVVDFVVAEDVVTDIEKEELFPFCLLFAIFCMAFIIIVVFFYSLYTKNKQHERKKNEIQVKSNEELVLIK